MLQIRWGTCSVAKLFRWELRAHLLVENALNAILTTDAFNLSLPKACFAKNYEEGELVKDRRQTVPVLDSVVVERDVLNIADTESNRGDQSQTIPVPDSVVIQREVPDLIHKAVELYERPI